MKNFNEHQLSAVLKAADKNAEASWSATVLCRFSTRAEVRESGRGLPHSKTLPRFFLPFSKLQTLDFR